MTRSFTSNDFAERMARAGRQAADAGLTGVLVTPGPDLVYFTGYAPIAITERITMLVLHADRAPAMIVPILERPDAEVSPGALPDSSYVAMTGALPLLRAVKDADELERLAAELAGLLRKHGHSEVDFTVVGSGPNGANPHHEMSQRVIEEGDMVVLDFGGIKDGYGSDTTRTVHVGEPNDEEREVFEVVRRAQQAGFEAVRPGVDCQEIDRAARRVITDAGYGEYFIHRVGHGIGLTTHEPPYMVEGETLPAGALRRAHRGHRGGDGERRPALEQHATRDAHRRLGGGWRARHSLRLLF